MADRVYKQVEITGSSTATIEDAVNTALARAGKTVRQMRWFEVTDIRGDIDNSHVKHWQVTIKVGFTLDD